MKYKEPATIIAAVKPDELILLTKLTEVSRWRIYLTLIAQAQLFLGDLVIDIGLVITYLINGEISEALFTTIVHFIAGIITSAYYWFNEEWIDSSWNLDDDNPPKPSGSQNALELEMTEMSPSQSNGNSDDLSETDLLYPGTSGGGPNVIHHSRAILQQQQLPTINNSPKKSKLRRLRNWSRYLLISPIFRAYFLVQKFASSIDFIEETRLKRDALSVKEIDAIVTIREGQIIQACFNMIETFFEALPQTLLQIYLAANLKFTLQPETFSEWFKCMSIVWSLLSATYTATRYSDAYYMHLKIAHIKDNLFLGEDFNLKTFRPLGWITWFAMMFFNFTVMVGRIYGLTHILVTWGVASLIFFVTILYITQFIWLEKCPAQRLFYENPTRGIMTVVSNLVDRWKNIFCFHQIRPSLISTIAFHGIFVFLFLLFCKFLEFIVWVQLTLNGEQTDNDTLKLVNNNIYSNSGQCDFRNFRSTCNLSHVILNENGVLACCFISFLISLLYLWVRKNRDKVLLDNHFPILKTLELWGELTDEDLGTTSLERKRALCLCVVASDDDLRQILGEMCPGCRYKKGAQHAAPVLLSDKFQNLWYSYTERYQFYWLKDIKNQREIIREHWAILKKVKIENAGSSANINYINRLNEMIDPLFMETENSIDVKDLQLFLYFYDGFEIFLSKTNSFRLGKIFFCLGQNLKNNKCSAFCICY